MLKHKSLLIIIVIVGTIASLSMLTFVSAVASKGNLDLFKNWKSLVGPLVDLQVRVSELEALVESQEARIEELEQLIDNENAVQEIEIQIDEFVYEVGDDVSISGAVSEDVFDPEEELFIAIIFPGVAFEEAVDLDSDGEFELAYEIPDNAVDGVYTVRVEYSTFQAFSYFIVDEDNNEVEIEVEDDAYLRGQNVEFVGFVEDVVPGVDEVELTVMDPNGDKLLNEEDTSLDANDEFGFDFDLDDDAPLGRYAIIVMYDDAESGEALFEVHE